MFHSRTANGRKVMQWDDVEAVTGWIYLDMIAFNCRAPEGPARKSEALRPANGGSQRALALPEFQIKVLSG